MEGNWLSIQNVIVRHFPSQGLRFKVCFAVNLLRWSYLFEIKDELL